MGLEMVAQQISKGLKRSVNYSACIDNTNSDETFFE